MLLASKSFWGMQLENAVNYVINVIRSAIGISRSIEMNRCKVWHGSPVLKAKERSLAPRIRTHIQGSFLDEEASWWRRLTVISRCVYEMDRSTRSFHACICNIARERLHI